MHQLSQRDSNFFNDKKIVGNANKIIWAASFSVGRAAMPSK
jgi:hypothetical protein